MFYVSSCKEGLYGITDTRDGIEEFYTKQQIYRYSTKNIAGVIQESNGKRIEVYDLGYSLNYKLVEFDRLLNIFTVKEIYTFRGSNVPHPLSVKGDILKLKLHEVLARGINIDGISTINSTKINTGDSVLIGRERHFESKSFWSSSDNEVRGRWFMLKAPNKYDEFNKFGKDISDFSQIPSHYLMYFNTAAELTSYIRINRLTVVNSISTDPRSPWWMSDREPMIDLFLIREDTIISLGWEVTCHFLGTLERILERVYGFGYNFGEAGTGFYNPKGNCYHFVNGVHMLSFELGTSEPTGTLLKQGRYDWESDLRKYGFCITRAKTHATKKYANDIEFYSK